MSLIERVKQWARGLKRDVIALWIAARDKRTPLAAKLGAAMVATYALSPIDLIPDFVPVLGYLDDLLIVPLGILMAVKLIPPALMAEFRREAAGRDKPVSRTGLVFMLLVWLAGLGLLGWWIYQRVLL
jgi:uncharacterized membrane protein YkvA (DUF1232 family)